MTTNNGDPHPVSPVFGKDRLGIGARGLAVAELAVALADALGLPPEGQARLRTAAQLHDIGMLAIPTSTLNKVGPLNRADRAQIHLHPAIGELLLRIDGLGEIAAWVRSHHERPDGRGYPDRLRGEQIPVPARILAIADGYQAMLSDRPHRPRRTPREARKELLRGAATLQFDPGLVAVFLASCTTRRRRRKKAAQSSRGRPASGVDASA